MVHRDFHIGNILHDDGIFTYISDMGLCGEVSNVDTTKIYGVKPYIAPEVFLILKQQIFTALVWLCIL